MDDSNQFFSDVANLFEGIFDITKTMLPAYKEFADDVVCERITDIEQIERQLDSMLTYCFNAEILLYFKAILRKLYKTYPDTVHAYVKLYCDMYGSEDATNAMS